MYDVAIVGTGLGGLICADILSKEGMKICMIEQHSVLVEVSRHLSGMVGFLIQEFTM